MLRFQTCKYTIFFLIEEYFFNSRKDFAENTEHNRQKKKSLVFAN